MAKRSAKTAGATDEPAATQGSEKNLRVTNQEGKSRARILAELVVTPTVLNASTVTCFAKGMAGEIDITEAIVVMTEKVVKVKAGDLTDVETTLVAQAMALDAVFNEMARRAPANMGEYLNATETYLRLGLKAQAQCRATLQTLAEIKNPQPVTFVRQANIANGPQQVNNGTPPREARSARAGNPDMSVKRTFGATYDQRLNIGTAGASGGADRQLETVGALQRP
jgi:hypothetical protein